MQFKGGVFVFLINVSQEIITSGRVNAHGNVCCKAESGD